MSHVCFSALYAYFNINSDKGMQTRNGNSAPVIKVPSMMQRSELKNRRNELELLKSEKTKLLPKTIILP